MERRSAVQDPEGRDRAVTAKSWLAQSAWVALKSSPAVSGAALTSFLPSVTLNIPGEVLFKEQDSHNRTNEETLSLCLGRYPRETGPGSLKYQPEAELGFQR